MTEQNIYTFRADQSAGLSFTKGVSLVAAVLAPIYLYFGEDVRNIYFLAGFTAFAAVVPFLMRWLRSLVGGIESLAVSDESIELIGKKSSELILWDDIAEVEFERVNDMPWVTFITNEKEKHRVLLEDFAEADRLKLHELITGELPDKTQDKTTWIIANRLSFSYSENSAKSQTDVDT